MATITASPSTSVKTTAPATTTETKPQGAYGGPENPPPPSLEDRVHLSLQGVPKEEVESLRDQSVETLGHTLGELPDHDKANVQTLSDVSMGLGLLPEGDRKAAIEAMLPNATPEEVDKFVADSADPKYGELARDSIFGQALSQYAGENLAVTMPLDPNLPRQDAIVDALHQQGWSDEQIQSRHILDGVALLNPNGGDELRIPRRDMMDLSLQGQSLSFWSDELMQKQQTEDFNALLPMPGQFLAPNSTFDLVG